MPYIEGQVWGMHGERSFDLPIDDREAALLVDDGGPGDDIVLAEGGNASSRGRQGSVHSSCGVAGRP